MSNSGATAGRPLHENEVAPPWSARRERILADYFSLLAAASSPLLSAGPDVETQVASQFLAVVDDAAGTVGGDAPGGALSRDIGRSRAASGVHPAVSLAAAQLIFVAALPGLVDHLRDLGVGEPTQAAAIRLNDAILRRMADAAANYVGYLLDKADQAHRDEAKRLSRDLHDAVGPSITTAIHSLDLAERYRSSDPEACSAKIARGRETLVQAHASLRQLAAETRTIFEPGDMVQALTDHLAHLPDHVRGDILVQGSVDDIPAQYERETFLILREAIRNSARHSRATRVSVQIQVEGIRLLGTVEDDGRGLDQPNTSSRHGTGMLSMRERAALLGGALDVEAMPDGGTRVALSVPLPNRAT